MQDQRGRVVGLLVACMLGLGSQALAHQPSYSQGEHVSPETAWPITDIDLSIVLYHAVTCEAPVLWLAFRADEPRDIFYQLGVPEIERLTDYRPSIALLAPGLPEITEPLPFEVPEGVGAIITHTTDLETPDDFFEPFTQTASWILEETTQTLPEAGIGYLVAWHPEGQTGKLWVAVGDVEDFSNIDIDAAESWFDNTQSFHEVPPWDPDPPVEEQICLPPEPEPEPEPELEPEPDALIDEGAEADTTDPAAGAPELTAGEGCSGATGSSGPLHGVAWLLALWWCASRRPSSLRVQ